VPVGDGIQDGKMAIDRGLQARITLDVAVMDPSDPTEDRVKWPHSMLEKRLSGHRQDQLVDATVEDVKLFDANAVPPLAQETLYMQELIAV
jgi:hypothetical protein